MILQRTELNHITRLPSETCGFCSSSPYPPHCHAYRKGACSTQPLLSEGTLTSFRHAE